MRIRALEIFLLYGMNYKSIRYILKWLKCMHIAFIVLLGLHLQNGCETDFGKHYK